MRPSWQHGHGLGDIPVIDVFAGPGGLSEGFSRSHVFSGGGPRFRMKLSIEKDPDAARTLRLRAYVRQFEEGQLPEVYYHYVRANDSKEQERFRAEIEASPEWEAAGREVWQAELGRVDRAELHGRISKALDGAPVWVLLGGPPCQAYSVVGRSRRIGLGEIAMAVENGGQPVPTEEERAERKAERLVDFLKDERHTLYKEYLEIVAIHQPPVFVMENVKGILSSKIHHQTPDGPVLGSVFEQILADLRAPAKAVEVSALPDGVALPEVRHGYTLHSFVTHPTMLDGGYAPKDYLIRAEDYGVPQERHRVILLGIRNDLAGAKPDILEPVEPRVPLKGVIGDLPPLRSGRSNRHGAKGADRDTPARWQEAITSFLTPEVLDGIPETYRAAMRPVLERDMVSLTRGARFIPGPPGLDVERLGDLGRWLHDPRLGGVLQHETRDHMDSDFARYLFVAAYGEIERDSPKLRHFPEVLLPNHRNAHTEEGRRIFHDRFRVQLPDKPASTITSHIRKDGHYFIHYDKTQCRSLTVREAARIQTFPDNYIFEGNRTAQYEQVGNAVPSYLALQVAKIITTVVMRM